MSGRSIIRSAVDEYSSLKVDHIASWIKKLHTDPEQWEAISQRAVATAQKYSLQEIAAQWDRCPPSAMPRRAGRRATRNPILVSA
jgi:hypothetical protein